MLRLPLEIKDLFREWLEAASARPCGPGDEPVRQMRHGRDYDARWAERMKGDGPIAELIGARFAAARRRYGLDGVRPALDLTQFKVPKKAENQLELFG